MSTHRLADGRDTHTLSSAPQATPHQAKKVLLTSGGPTSYGYVQFGKLASLVRGKRVVVASLSARAVEAHLGQTITVALPSQRYDIATLKWADRPENRGTIVEQFVGPVDAGQRWSGVDVAALVQLIANGVADFGFRIGTSASGTREVYSFEASRSGWILELELAEVPPAPAALSPAGVVGTGKPLLTWDGAEQQAELQVRVDPNASTTAPAFSSGTVASSLAQYDLASSGSGSAYPGLAPGATTQWQVRQRPAGEDWSLWSDWVAFTNTPRPNLTITAPAGGTVTDPSPVVTAQVSTGTVRQYQVLVTDPETGQVRYDSGRVPLTNPAAAFSHEIRPEDRSGRLVFATGEPYVVTVRAWDSTDRQSTPGSPAYAQATKTVTLTSSSGTAPTLLSVTQDGNDPGLRVRLSRPAAPQAWVIERDGEIVLRSEPSEGDVVPIPAGVAGAAGVYEWVDTTVAMSGSPEYRAFTITEGVLSAPSAVVVGEPVLHGVWLLWPNGDRVKLENDQVTREPLERRTSLSPPGLGYDIDTVTAVGGYGGDITGTVDTNTTPPLQVVLPIIEAARLRPEEVIRLVERHRNVPVTLRGLGAAPDEFWTPERMRHQVSAGYQQVGDLPEDL